MNNVRIWYKKYGSAIYISHLDINRCFIRAVRMAGIPLWYTEGFNPHPYLNFLLPLPLGETGLKEPVDIRPEIEITYSEIKEKLNSVLPEGIEIVDVTDPINKSNEIKYAGYDIQITTEDRKDLENYCEKIISLIESGEIFTEKHTKKGFKTINLCDFIKSFDCTQNNNIICIKTELSAGTTENLNAGLLVDSIIRQSDINAESYSITRYGIFTESGLLF